VSATVWVVGLSLCPVSRTPPTLATRAPALARLSALLHPGVHFSDALDCTRPSGSLAEASEPSSSSLGVLQRPPLRRHQARESTSGCPEPEAATPRTCSTLAVSHDFGGFLLTGLRRFVAPCSRPWSSPGFQPRADARCKQRFAGNPTVLTDVTPFGAFPSSPSGTVSLRRTTDAAVARPPPPYPSRCQPGRSPKRPDWPQPQGGDPVKSP